MPSLGWCARRNLRKEQGYRCYCNTVPSLLRQEESQKRTGLPALLQWPMLPLSCCARTRKQVPVQVPEPRSRPPHPTPPKSFDAIPLSGYGTATTADERVDRAAVLPYLLRRWLLLWHVWHEQQGVVDTRHAAALHTSPLPSAPPPSLLRWTLLSAAAPWSLQQLDGEEGTTALHHLRTDNPVSTLTSLQPSLQESH